MLSPVIQWKFEELNEVATVLTDKTSSLDIFFESVIKDCNSSNFCLDESQGRFLAVARE